jgi:hypothetical protein
MNPLEIMKRLISVLVEQFVPSLGLTREGVGMVLLDMVLDYVPRDKIHAHLDAARAVQIDKAVDLYEAQKFSQRPTDPGEEEP